MEYYFLGWTFWAIVVAMHAIWWAWIAPNINTKLRVEGDEIWQYFHWLPYVTTLSLLFWPFLALDKIQNWSPSDNKSVLATLYIFSLEAFVIFACFTKLIACKDCPNLFGDIASKVGMGRRHKIQKSFAPHGGAFFFANIIGMFALYSFVIAPNEATAKSKKEIPTHFDNQSFEIDNPETASSILHRTNNNIGAVSAVPTNNIGNNIVQIGPLGENNNGDNSNRIIGPDGQLIEGEIIASAETINNQTKETDNTANLSVSANGEIAKNETLSADNAPISLAPAYMPTWQLVEASTRFSKDEISPSNIEQSIEFLGSSAEGLANSASTE